MSEPVLNTLVPETTPVASVFQLIKNMINNDSTTLRGLQWLRAFAVSGIDIEAAIFLELAEFMTHRDPLILECTTLMQSLVAATWLRSWGRDQLQSLLATMHTRLASRLQKELMVPGESKDLA
jgi:hypothetical protein